MQNKKKILDKKFSHFIFDIDGVILNSKNNMRLSWVETNNKRNEKNIKLNGVFFRKPLSNYRLDF